MATNFWTLLLSEIGLFPLTLHLGLSGTLWPIECRGSDILPVLGIVFKRIGGFYFLLLGVLSCLVKSPTSQLEKPCGETLRPHREEASLAEPAFQLPHQKTRLWVNLLGPSRPSSCWPNTTEGPLQSMAYGTEASLIWGLLGLLTHKIIITLNNNLVIVLSH